MKMNNLFFIKQNTATDLISIIIIYIHIIHNNEIILIKLIINAHNYNRRIPNVYEEPDVHLNEYIHHLLFWPMLKNFHSFLKL